MGGEARLVIPGLSRRQRGAAGRYQVARIGGPPRIRAGGWWPVFLRCLVGGGVIAGANRAGSSAPGPS